MGWMRGGSNGCVMHSVLTSRAGLIGLAAVLLMVVTPVCSWAQTIRILVHSAPLAGFQYHAAGLLWSQLQRGDALQLVREPSNRHDRHAVRVDWRGQSLGYLPRTQNREVAAELDRGNRVEARIGALREDPDPWQRLRVDVYLVL
jgi:hypothetical protein